MSVDVSVVIPTYGRPVLLRRALAAIAASTLGADRFEVIVVDDGSLDETPDVVARAGVRCHRQANAGPAAARNAGWRLAEAPLVAFTDDDCVPAPTWLAELVAAFDRSTSEVVGVGGRIDALRPGFLATYVGLERLVDHGVDPDGAPRYLVTANAAFRRESLERAGGFDESFGAPAGEDVDLSLRLRLAGGRLVVAPGAVVCHDHRTGMRPLLRTYRRHGRARHLLAARHDDDYLAGSATAVGPSHWVDRWRRYRGSVGRPAAAAYLAVHAVGSIAFAVGLLEARR